MRVHAAGLLLVLLAASAVAQAPTKFIDGLRGETPIPEETHPPRLSNWVNNDQRVTRNWDKQPPIVPHRVDGYQIDKNFNKCMDCHARERTPFSQAIPVSETHYIDRSGKVLDRISTRRYFCMQCHVAQEAVSLPVGNTFRGVQVQPSSNR
jgi:nitrate reductase (cytochrome), electron transfer subunit